MLHPKRRAFSVEGDEYSKAKEFVRQRLIADISPTVNSVAMSSLQQAVADVRDGSSLYWAFYHPEDRKGDPEVVEIRLDATPEIVANFVAPEGWQLDRVEWGDTLFLRKHQSLELEAVEAMLLEVLEHVSARGMRLHSWLHGPDVQTSACHPERTCRPNPPQRG